MLSRDVDQYCGTPVHHTYQDRGRTSEFLPLLSRPTWGVKQIMWVHRRPDWMLTWPTTGQWHGQMWTATVLRVEDCEWIRWNVEGRRQIYLIVFLRDRATSEEHAPRSVRSETHTVSDYGTSGWGSDISWWRTDGGLTWLLSTETNIRNKNRGDTYYTTGTDHPVLADGHRNIQFWFIIK